MRRYLFVLLLLVSATCGCGSKPLPDSAATSCGLLSWYKITTPSKDSADEEWQLVCQDTQRIEGRVLYYEFDPVWNAFKRGRNLGDYKTKDAAMGVVDKAVRP